MSLPESITWSEWVDANVTTCLGPGLCAVCRAILTLRIKSASGRRPLFLNERTYFVAWTRVEPTSLRRSDVHPWCSIPEVSGIPVPIGIRRPYKPRSFRAPAPSVTGSAATLPGFASKGFKPTGCSKR